MALCIDDAGRVDWQGYHLLTTAVPLRDFLDLEELASVAHDRRLAWEVFMSERPDYFKGLGARQRPENLVDVEALPKRPPTELVTAAARGEPLPVRPSRSRPARPRSRPRARGKG